MKYIKQLAILTICLGLDGCVAAASKQVHFICGYSIVPSDFGKQFTVIAQAHQFSPAPQQDAGLLFYSDLKSAPQLFAVVDSSSSSNEVILGISILRAPGSEDKLPPEILDVFNAIIHETHTQILSGCTLKNDEWENVQLLR